MDDVGRKEREESHSWPGGFCGADAVMNFYSRCALKMNDRWAAQDRAGRETELGHGGKASPSSAERVGPASLPHKRILNWPKWTFRPFLDWSSGVRELALALVVFGNWSWWILKLLRPEGVCRQSYPQLSTQSLPTGRWGLFTSTSANLSLYEKEHKRNAAGENQQDGVWGWESLVRTSWRWGSLLLLRKR